MIEQMFELPCGSQSRWDHGAGYGYRCDDCGAVIGSISMPRSCAILYKQAEEMNQVVDRLNGM